MEYSPPPLFKQGASARAKVVFFSLIAIALLVADSRVRSLTLIRQAVGTVLYPLQMAALVPRDIALNFSGYFTTLSAVQRENQGLRVQQTSNAQLLQQAQQLAAENNQLRKLLGASEQLGAPTLMSEILYDARDTGSRKIVVNRGAQDGVSSGMPVIDDVGVVGQVTRVFPFSAEVTLLTDKDQAIPVQVVRSGLRSVAYGRGSSGVLDLRFMAANADIRNGDVLVTSGIDGVYPPGLAVAKVIQVENKSSDAFARIQCQPTAGIDRNRQLLILLANTQVQPRPETEEERDKKDNLGRKRARELFQSGQREREAAREAAPAAAPAVTPAPAPAPAAAAPAPLPAAGGQVAPNVLREPPPKQAAPATAPATTTTVTPAAGAATAPANAPTNTTNAPAAAQQKPAATPAITPPKPNVTAVPANGAAHAPATATTTAPAAVPTATPAAPAPKGATP